MNIDTVKSYFTVMMRNAMRENMLSVVEKLHESFSVAFWKKLADGRVMSYEEVLTKFEAYAKGTELYRSHNRLFNVSYVEVEENFWVIDTSGLKGLYNRRIVEDFMSGSKMGYRAFNELFELSSDAANISMLRDFVVVTNIRTLESFDSMGDADFYYDVGENDFFYHTRSNHEGFVASDVAKLHRIGVNYISAQGSRKAFTVEATGTDFSLAELLHESIMRKRTAAGVKWD